MDNTLRDLQNSSYPTKAEFNDCFIIHSKYFPVLKEGSPFRSLFFRSLKVTSTVELSAAGCTFDVRHRFNNLKRAALLTSLIQYREDSFQIW